MPASAQEQKREYFCSRELLLERPPELQNPESIKHVKGEAACRALLSARTYAARGDFSNAAKEAARASRLSKAIKEAALAESIAYAIRAKEFAFAAKHLKRLKHKSLLEHKAELAHAQFLVSDTPKTRFALARAARVWLKKTGDKVRPLLMIYALEKGQKKNALKRLLTRHPHDERVLFLDDKFEILNANERLVRAKNLMGHARYFRALKELKAGLFLAEKKTFKRSHEFKRLLVEAYVRAGQKDDALTFATSWNDKEKSTASLSALAWTQGKRREFDDAAKTHLARMNLHKNKEKKTNACFSASFAHYDAKKYDAALTQLQACEKLSKKADILVAVRWYQALIHLLKGDDQKAQVVLERLIKKHAKDREIRKHEYFLARTLLRKDAPDTDVKRAKALLQKLWRENPTDYYGLRARTRLGEKPVMGAKIEGDAFAKTHKKSALQKGVQALFDHGFDSDAKDLAASQKDIALSAAVGDGWRVYRKGPRYFPRPMVLKNKGVDALQKSAGWRASFQTPYRKLVDDAAKAHGIGQDLIYAIMRTESGFREKAKSPVGALGLLQLMPYTARGLAQKRGVDAPKVSALTLPQVSIDFGASFLAISQRELGHPWLAAAGYNGSPENVAQWLKDFGDLEPELFVERVPYKETRNYIKRVSATMAMYRALDGEPLALDWPSAFHKNEKPVTWFPRTTGDR